MPLPIVKLVSKIGEGLAQLTGNPPLIPGGQLEFLLWGAIPNSGKAQKELGWEPTTLKDGIKETIDYLFR
jgi:nucleoside-diphosphate-sugar epimerase